MSRLVYALLILAAHLCNTFAVGLKQLSDEGQVRRIVSALHRISKQLASERAKENVVFGEIKRYCQNTDDETDSGRIKHNLGAELDDSTDDDYDEGTSGFANDDPSVPASHMIAQAAGGLRRVVLSDSPQPQAKVVAAVPNGQPLTLVSDYVADGDYVKVRWQHAVGYTNRANVVPARHDILQETPRASEGVHNVADVVKMSEQISALKPDDDDSPANKHVNLRPHAGPFDDAPKTTPLDQRAEPPRQKVAPDMETEDPSKDLEQMQALLDGHDSEEMLGSEPARIAKTKAPARREIEGTTPKKLTAPPSRMAKHDDEQTVSQHVDQDAMSASNEQLASIMEEVPRTTKKVGLARAQAVGATPGEATAELAAKRLERDEQTVSQHDDQEVMHASEEQLASIIKESVDPHDKNVMTARSEPASAFQPDESLDSIFATDSAAADTGPLGNPIVAVNDIEDDESKRAALSAEPKPLEHPPVTAVGQAVQSEFDETSDLVSSLEEEYSPKPKKRMATKGQPRVAGDVNVASVSAALDDLGGAIPSIDKQALELYNANGGDQVPLDPFGVLGSGPTFLQLGKRQQQLTRMKVVAVNDLNSAWDALQGVAEDTKNALSMIETLRRTGWGQADRTARPEGDSDDQCTVLIQEFRHRRQVRASHEAKLTKHSQRLLKALGHIRTTKAKHLRRQL